MWNYAKNFAAERQLLRLDVRAVRAGSGQPRLRQHRQRRAPDQRRGHRRGHRRRRPGRRLVDRGCPALLRRLLDPRRGLAHRHEPRRRAQREGPQLGLVPGRIQAEHDVRPGLALTGHEPADEHVHAGPVQDLLREREQPARELLQPGRCATPCTRSASRSEGTASTATRTTTSRTTSRSSTTPRRPTRTTWRRRHCGDRHRHAVVRERCAAVRQGQPPVRHERLQRAGGRDRPRLPLARQPAGGELPQGSRLPGRARGVLRPVRRAAVRHLGDQRPGADAGLVEHRSDHHLRRLGRVLRPRLQRRPQPVEHERSRQPARSAGLPDRHGPLRHRARRSPGRTAAVATARGCRSCSSHRGPSGAP